MYDAERAQKAVDGVINSIKEISRIMKDDEAYVITEMSVNHDLAIMIELFILTMTDTVKMAHETAVRFDL